MPHPDVMTALDPYDPQALLDTLGGLARGVHLQRFGVTRTQLSKAVRAGRIERIRPGTFASTTLSAPERAAVLHGGALTCAGALRRHGLWVLSDEGAPHVWVGHRGRVYDHARCDCTTHYFRDGSALGLVDVETALVHLFHCEGAEAFFVSLESALQQRKLPASARLRMRAGLPASARRLVDFARSDAESGLESLLRVRLHLLGIALQTQVHIDGVGRVDFVAAGRLIIEVDGRQNHATSERRHHDLVRDAAASAVGYETLRFDYAQIVHDWPTVRAAILAALTRLAD